MESTEALRIRVTYRGEMQMMKRCARSLLDAPLLRSADVSGSIGIHTNSFTPPLSFFKTFVSCGQGSSVSMYRSRALEGVAYEFVE